MNDHAPTTPPSPLFWFLDAFRRYAEFGGRSRRSAYWWFFLLQFILQFLLGLLLPVLATLHWIVSLLPGIAVATRRLHDTDRSGWWWLINLIPILGQIVFVVFLASDGTRGANRYGPDPKTGEAEPVMGGFCSSCGTAVDVDAAFCGTCGARRG